MDNENMDDLKIKIVKIIPSKCIEGEGYEYEIEYQIIDHPSFNGKAIVSFSSISDSKRLRESIIWDIRCRAVKSIYKKRMKNASNNIKKLEGSIL